MNKLSSTVLMYHHIGRNDLLLYDREYAVERGMFLRHLDLIQRESLDVVLPDEWPKQVKARSVVITFDDGYKDNYVQAYPILKERGLRAIFFVTVEHIDSTGYMSWQDLKEMAAAGMRIGSHGLTHRFFSMLSASELTEELKESRRTLEERLAVSVKMLSLPGGRKHPELQSIALESGYEYIFTSQFQFVDNISRGPFLNIPRIAIRKNTGVTCLENILRRKPGIMWRNRLKDRFKKVIQNFIGHKRYDKLYRRFQHMRSDL